MVHEVRKDLHETNENTDDSIECVLLSNDGLKINQTVYQHYLCVYSREWKPRGTKLVCYDQVCCPKMLAGLSVYPRKCPVIAGLKSLDVLHGLTG